MKQLLKTTLAPSKSLFSQSKKIHQLKHYPTCSRLFSSSSVLFSDQTTAEKQNEKPATAVSVEYLPNDIGLKTPLQIAERRWWITAYPNIGFITDTFRPSLTLHLKDADGQNYVQNLKYKCTFRSIGLKPEVCFRVHLAFLNVNDDSKPVELAGIPRKITIPGGSWTFNAGAFQLATIPIPELNAKLSLTGIGLGIVEIPFLPAGIAKNTGGEIELVTEPSAIQQVPKEKAFAKYHKMHVVIGIMVVLALVMAYYVYLVFTTEPRIVVGQLFGMP